MKNPQVNALKKNPGTPISTRIVAGAAILLLQANMALAFQSQSANTPAQNPPPATTTLQTPQQQVPFNEMLQHSHNPFDAYRGKIVPPPSMANSPRLNSLIRDGKLYLSLRDAIDLALENNLDIVIARYNLPIAQMDILRTKAGGVVRGVQTGVVSGTPGGAAAALEPVVALAAPAQAPAVRVLVLAVSCNPPSAWEPTSPATILSFRQRSITTTLRRSAHEPFDLRRSRLQAQNEPC